MPYKDPFVAKNKKRENYLANREKYIRQSAERRLRLQAEAAAQKALASIGPQKPKERVCVDCSEDITFTYNGKNGHRCKACVAKYHAMYRTKNSARIAAQKKAWKESNVEHIRALEKKYSVTNAKNKAAARKKWASANPDKEKSAKAANRADRIMRVPAWSNREKIKAYYNVCSFFNEINGYAKYHVDHIIPLNGKRVSGLHVHNNLQVILAKDNLRKGNSHAQ